MHVVNSSTANLQGLQQYSNSYDLYLSIAVLCYEDPCIQKSLEGGHANLSSSLWNAAYLKVASC